MNIAIIGYGKMGKMIEQLALEKGHQILLKITSKNTADLNIENLQKVDIAIEFSNPENAFQNIKTCLTLGVPVISGTTGWLEHLDEIKHICKEEKGAFLYASNFSIGVNIFFQLNEYLAKTMNQQPSYDVSMTEIHHTQKLDAPSGTAISLAQQIVQNVHRKNEVSIQSKRVDKVAGTHHVLYESSIDSIEIKHTAHSREGFASGALLAAEWIIGKQGIFEMKDVLDIL